VAGKKKKGSHRKKGLNIPMAVVGGIIPVVTRGAATIQASGWKVGLNNVASWFTGWDANTGNWSIKNLYYGALPIGVGMVVHKVASRLGVNRALASAGIPFFRV